MPCGGRRQVVLSRSTLIRSPKSIFGQTVTLSRTIEPSLLLQRNLYINSSAKSTEMPKFRILPLAPLARFKTCNKTESLNLGNGRPGKEDPETILHDFVLLAFTKKAGSSRHPPSRSFKIQYCQAPHVPNLSCQPRFSNIDSRRDLGT